MLKCNVRKELPVYKLAKTAEEAFQNLDLDKVAQLEEGFDQLGDWADLEQGGRCESALQHSWEILT